MSFSSMTAEIDRSPLFSHVTTRLWQRCLSIRNQFCDAVVNSGLLTWEQMVSASCRYCIGSSKKGGVIFWQIDQGFEPVTIDGNPGYFAIVRKPDEVRMMGLQMAYSARRAMTAESS